jgi:DNA-directed RNA polymerase specialized sigma24 family protein
LLLAEIASFVGSFVANIVESHVTSNDEKENRPWWETELPTIKAELTGYLRRHVPALRNDHEDLVSDTLWSLAKYFEQNSSLPSSWFNDQPPTNEERSRFHKLAHVILKRRIADHFRKSLSFPDYVDTLPDWAYESHAVGHERKVIAARILAVVQSALDRMSAEDRDLIVLISERNASSDALSDRDRKRLHRIRKKLKERIAQKLGPETAALVKVGK